MSIMNMPPLPYLARIPGIQAALCTGSYTDPSVWDGFDPRLMTLCSPDPQAFRPPDQPANVLQVRLPTNFKAARFDSDEHTALLRSLAADIEAARFEANGEKLELPVKLKIHDSVFVPLAKWAMLIAGNYRCVQADSMRSIRDAVHGDLKATRSIYEWVVELCVSLARAATTWSLREVRQRRALAAIALLAARALAAGAPHIERVDRLVQSVADQNGKSSLAVDEIVALVDSWLVRNRRKG
jgi:hypothetical protein